MIPHAQLVRPHRALAIAGVVSAALYGVVALALPTSNRPLHVAAFLALFALLFALYLVAWRAVSAAREDSPIPNGSAPPRAPRPSARRQTALVLGFAALFRLLLVLAGLPGATAPAALVDDLTGRRVAYEPFLLYDNDLWRYLWDGHVLARGFDPYRLTPDEALADAGLEERLVTGNWRDVVDNASYHRYGTIYPPLTHYVFAALARLAPGSAAAAKLLLALLDLSLCWLLARLLAAAGRDPALTLVYAWNPVVIKEIAGSGHPDVLMVLPLMAAPWLLARGFAASGGALAAASILAKLASLATLPLVAAWSWVAARRRPRGPLPAAVACALVLAVGLWPLVGGLGDWLAALRVFAERWTFNSGPWAVVRWLAAALGAARPDQIAHLVTRSAIAGGALWILFVTVRGAAGRARDDAAGRLRDLYGGVFLTLALVVLLSPAVMPWYALWALPAAVVASNRTWAIFCGLTLLSYLSYADGVGTLWWKWLEYGLFGVLVARARFATATPR